MENIISTTYPDCDKDTDIPNGCFERYIKAQIQFMKDFKLCHLTVEEFDETHIPVFKRIEEEMNKDGKHFGWHIRSHNIGTIKAAFAYSVDLYLKQ